MVLLLNGRLRPGQLRLSGEPQGLERNFSRLLQLARLTTTTEQDIPACPMFFSRDYNLNKISYIFPIYEKILYFILLGNYTWMDI